MRANSLNLRKWKVRVEGEDENWYWDKVSSRERRFFPKREEAVVSFYPQAWKDAERDLTRGTGLFSSVKFDPDRGYAVFTALPDAAAEAVSIVRSTESPSVLNSLAVMTDDEGLTRYFVPDELTVQFRPEIGIERMSDLVSKARSSVVAEQRTSGYFTLAVPEGKGLFETIRRFAELDEVVFAGPSEVGFDDDLAHIPSSADFFKQWGLHNTGQIVQDVKGLKDADIDAVEAWDLTRGDPKVVIAIIDTGVDLDHPNLLSNLLSQGVEDWNFADPGSTSPDDRNGHGTSVAGVAGAVESATGAVGVAPKCQIMPLRVSLDSGKYQDRADAINYVVDFADQHPDLRFVVNCSWKMSGDSQDIHNAIVRAVRSDIVVVVAAGNDNRDIADKIAGPAYPAVYPEVIPVAATDQKDKKSQLSNFGSSVVCAPGSNIYTTYPDKKHKFWSVAGFTSLAAPHVAGLAALILARNSNLSSAQVRTIIEDNCDNIDPKNPGLELGNGRINAAQALNAA